MKSENTILSEGFLGQQQMRLQTLRDQLVNGEAKMLADERSSQQDRAEEPQDSGEQSGNIAQGEVIKAVREADNRRLKDVERAIQKIADGTYGFSGLSGEPIPKARLNATPEAILTVQEEESREKKKR